MTNHTSILIAATAAMALAAFTAPAAAQDAGSVIIYRGAQAETVRFDDRGGVTVVRGQPAAQPAEPAYPAARRKVDRTVAGDTLWIVDGEADRLFACELRRTTQVGGRRIRCIERALPVALR